MLIRGAQFEHTGFGCIRVLEQFPVSTVAPMGVETELPLTLAYRPTTRASLALFAGEAPAGACKLQRLGLDYDVDLNTRKIRWLATARRGLPSDGIVVVRYWRRRPEVDVALVAQGLE